MSISHTHADIQENCSSVWKISKTIIWIKSVKTWWKSENDESRIRELDENQTIWTKHQKSITFWFEFHIHTLTYKKISRQYEKFQKRSSKSRTWKLDENQKIIKIKRFEQNIKNRPRFDLDFAYTRWHTRKFFVSMKNFKNDHLNRERENLMKIRRWWIENSWTWWKWNLKSMLRNHLINVIRTHINEMLNNDDREKYICI